MPNSTFYDCVNDGLSLNLLDQFTSTDDFDGTSGVMVPKYQLGMKAFVMLANQHLGLRAYKHFNERKITFNTVPGQAVYELDVGISGDDIKLRSFFNRTITAGMTGQNREIYNWRYEEYNTWVADPTNVESNSPSCWVLLPIDRSAQYPIWNIILWPTPDQIYTIEYQAKLDTQPLRESGDLILFPKHYEHAMWELAATLNEVQLGEGKEGKIGQMAMEAANQVWLAADEAADIRKAPRTMVLPRRRTGWTGWYNSPTQYDSQGNVIG